MTAPMVPPAAVKKSPFRMTVEDEDEFNRLSGPKPVTAPPPAPIVIPAPVVNVDVAAQKAPVVNMDTAAITAAIERGFAAMATKPNKRLIRMHVETKRHQDGTLDTFDLYPTYED